MKRIFFITISLLLAVLTSLFLAEILLHFNKEYSFDAMTINFTNKEPDYNVLRNSKTLGYEFIPNANKEINSFGMKDKEYALTKPKNAFRILLLGDSITELGKWSQYVEDKLNRNGKYEILNCAVRGWGLYNYFAYMKYKARQFEPDLTLIGFCLNDMEGSNIAFLTKVDDLWEERTAYAIKVNDGKALSLLTLSIDPFLFQNSYLYRFYVKNYISNKIIENTKNSKDFDSVSRLNQVKDFSGDRVLGIVFPYLKPLNEYNDTEKREYKATIDSLEQAGIRYLDLTGYFNKFGKDITRFRLHKDDKIHFSDDANKLKSEVIYNWMLQELNRLKMNTRT
ncbi:MAG: SGNH/GDSL hydrolase family protein [Elusimicrobia bacterium]|nr:SGNH/GDSL hydrolase family protein [Candidatus Liberimonas magnetica]